MIWASHKIKFTLVITLKSKIYNNCITIFRSCEIINSIVIKALVYQTHNNLLLLQTWYCLKLDALYRYLFDGTHTYTYPQSISFRVHWIDDLRKMHRCINLILCSLYKMMRSSPLFSCNPISFDFMQIRFHIK